MRYSLMLLLFVVAVGVPSRPVLNAPPDGPVAGMHDLPASVRESAQRGRHARASRILGEYLAVPRDTTAGAGLLTSHRRTPWKLAGAGADHLGSSLDGDDFERYLSLGDVDSTDVGLGYMRRGLVLGAAGRTADALEAFDRAGGALPWMADWANFFAAEAAAAAGDTAEVRRRLAAAGPGLTSRRGWRLRLEGARRAGDLMGARRAALDAARNATSAATRGAAWVYLGDLRLMAGETARAREAYRSAMEGSPGSVTAVDAARGLSRASPTPGEWRMIGSVYLRHGNPSRAIAGFERYLESGLGTADERAHVRLQVGQAMFNAGRYADAERRLLVLAEEPVSARVAADALYQAGLAQYRQGRSDEARRTLARVGERFPHQDAAARALFVLADLQHDDLDLAAARTNYRLAASASPTLNEAGLALMRLGGLHYLAEEYGPAAEVFEEYRTLRPAGRRVSQATYWAARSYAAMGRDEEADARLRTLRATDPLSYYGIRAGEIRGEAALAIPMEPSPPRRERTDSLVRNGLRRVDALARLDRRTELGHEVERLREHFAREDGGDYALAEGLNERGYTLTAISIGWDIFQREGAWNRRLLRVIYPFPFQALVLPASVDQDVDPYLVAAVIRRESAFNPTVTSSAGAIGLMQIMPHTGRGLARLVGLQRYDPEMLLQPEVNLHLGIKYLASLIRQFDGELPLVLSAYNAGPNRAVRWRAMPERRDPELFMERIPFTETRDYVRHVKIHHALYRELYPRLDAHAGVPGD